MANSNLKDLTFKQLATKWEKEKDKVDEYDNLIEKTNQPISPTKAIKTKEQYVREKCGEDPEKEKSRYYQKNAFSPIWVLLSFVLVGLVLWFTISMFSLGAQRKKDNAQLITESQVFELWNEPGYEWERWAQGLGNKDTFYLLEDTWYRVQNDWAKFGFDVTWDDVKEIEKTFEKSIRLDRDIFLERLLFAEIQNPKSTFWPYCGAVVGIIAEIIALILFIATIDSKISSNNNIKNEKSNNLELDKKHNEWFKLKTDAEKEYQNYYNNELNKFNKLNSDYQTTLKSYNEKIKKLEESRDKFQSNCDKIEMYVFNRCVDIIKKHTKMFTKANRERVENYELIWGLGFMQYVNGEKSQPDEKLLKKFFIDEEKENAARKQRVADRIREQERIEEENRLLAAERAEQRREERRLQRENEDKERRERYSMREEERRYNERMKEEDKKRQAEAKKQADTMAAIVRCSKCYLYATCCSYKKNKDPFCYGFKPSK